MPNKLNGTFDASHLVYHNINTVKYATAQPLDH